MKTFNYALQKEWFNNIALLLPFLAAPFISPYLPSHMAMHWELNGHATLYRSKIFGLLFLPVINISLYAIILNQSGKYKHKTLFTRTSLVFLLLITQTFNIAENMGMVYPPINFILPVTAILLLMGGFYFRSNTPENFIGIHLPWSFDDPQKWQKTHRFTIYLWIIAGLFLLALFPFSNDKAIINIFWITLLTVALLPTVYSFYLYNFKKISSSNSK